MPTNVFIESPPQAAAARAGALLLDHLEIAFEPVLDVGGGEVARIDQIGFDEGRRLAGALLDLAHHQQLAGGEAVAALDRVDQQAVGLVLVDVVRQHVDAHRQVAVGVDAEAVFGERLQRLVGIVAEAEIVDAADLGVARRDDDGALVIEHLPELAKARVVRRSFDDEPIFLLAHVAVGRDRPLALGEAIVHLLAQELVIFDGVIGAAEGAEDRADVIDAAEIGVDRRRLVLGALQHADEIVLRLAPISSGSRAAGRCRT